MNKKNIILIILPVLLLFRLPLASQDMDVSATQEVVARGLGSILSADEAKAEEDAISAALRNAVEQVVGTMIESNVLVKNYEVVEDQIYSSTHGYVQKYELLNKSRRGDNLIEVNIRAWVKKGNLEDDLNAIGLLISRKGKPRLMVLVDEINMDEHYWSYGMDMNTTENALMNRLMEKGFPFVDRETIARRIEKDAVLAALDGNERAARAIAEESGADLLIIGKAVAKPASNSPSVVRQAGFVSCQATVNLRAVRADDGRVVATSTQQAVAAHIDQMTGGTRGLQNAANLAADELSQKILGFWQKDVYSGGMVQLRILDVTDYNHLVKFKNLLQGNLRGVQRILQREFSNGTAVFDIELKGSASQVAEEIAAKDFSPFLPEIINVTSNAVIIKLSLQEN